MNILLSELSFYYFLLYKKIELPQTSDARQRKGRKKLSTMNIKKLNKLKKNRQSARK